MADLAAVAGAKIYIGAAAMAAPAEVDESDFDDVSWTEIDGWQTMGAIGDAAAEIATDLINRGRTVVQKGTSRSPASQQTFAINTSDPGQIALRAAARSRSNYPFRIVYDDAPPPIGTPSMQYFVGLVMSAQDQGGGANTARMMQATIAPNTNIVDIPAAEAGD